MRNAKDGWITMAKGLTKKQQEILEYILNYVEKVGYPPSIREIGKDFNIGSLRGVTVHLDALERKNYISRSNLPRSIRVVHPDFQQTNKVAMLPLLGSIAAGAPILAEEHVEDMIPVPFGMVRNATGAFVLRVRGDSMIEEGIMPEDLVVVRQQETARQNELVAVLIGEEATVKRINYTKEGIQLMPSNPLYKPIEVPRDEHAKVIGKIVGLLRDYT
ncbi:MAG TPA: transcriptional repressor LexA [Fimbriimonas sp.]|nr:transcriptional repressor LexA [Fimbriimonas sp.]